MKKATLTLAFAVALSVVPVSAAPQTVAPGHVDLTKFAYKFQPESAFSGPRADRIAAAGCAVAPMREAAAENPAPEFTYNGFSECGDIDGPDGQLWYYTLRLENEEVHYEYYTEKILRAYSVDIYDADRKYVGTVKDHMDYQDGEWRVPGCDVLPVITRNYFNDDDRLEIVIGLAVNWQPGINHYRSLVYQIGGEKDTDGDDVIVSTLPGLVNDVLDATGVDGEEHVFMTFMQENNVGEYPYDKDGTEAVWDFYMAQTISFSVYGKAGADGNLTRVLVHEMPMMCLPGDQESTPMLITMSDNDTPYAVFSRYKESFYNPFYSYQEDMSMRADNSLVIDIYALGDDSSSKVQTTEVKVAKDEGEDVLATYYSVGDLRYRGDINFHDFGNDGKATFTVCAANKLVGTDESLERSYYLVNPDGSIRTTLFRNALASLVLSDLKGFEPQAMFITADASGNAVYNFVDLISGRQAASFSNLIQVEDSDPDPLSTNIDRVVDGDTYKYVAEMLYPVEDNDNTYMRIAWLNVDGSVDHFDSVNMGIYVFYARSYLNPAILDSGFFHSDANREYIIMIKRGTEEGVGTVEEVLVATAMCEEYPDGRDLLLVSADPSRGPIASAYVYPYNEVPMLEIAYKDSTTGYYSVDYYRLPFDWSSGITDVKGDSILADDPVEVYNLQGIRLGDFASPASLGNLPAGLYIVRQADVTVKYVKK